MKKTETKKKIDYYYIKKKKITFPIIITDGHQYLNFIIIFLEVTTRINCILKKKKFFKKSKRILVKLRK